MPSLAKIAQSAALCCGATLAAIATAPDDHATPNASCVHHMELLPPAFAGRLGSGWTSVTGSALTTFKIVRSSAQRLRDLSGLPVTQLAKLAGVSRQTYHNWLTGEVISAEHLARLDGLIIAVSEISKHQDLRSFLKRPLYGTSPQAILENGDYELAAQLARGALLAPSTEVGAVATIPWNQPPSDLLTSYLYHSDPAAARPERVQLSEVFTDEVIALGSVVVTG